MESVGTKNHQRGLRALVALAISQAAQAFQAVALIKTAQTFVNAAASLAARVVSWDTPAQFTSGGPLPHAFLITASIACQNASAVDLATTVSLRDTGVVIAAAETGNGITGHVSTNVSTVSLAFVKSYPANALAVGVHSFGIQSDIGVGNTHNFAIGAAAVTVVPLF